MGTPGAAAWDSLPLHTPAYPGPGDCTRAVDPTAQGNGALSAALLQPQESLPESNQPRDRSASMKEKETVIYTAHTANCIADLIIYRTLADDDRRELGTAIARVTNEAIGATVGAADQG